MNKISTFNLHPLRNGEHYQFMSYLDAAIKKYAADVLGLKDVYPIFVSALAKENNALKIEQGSGITPEVSDGDKTRDRTWRCAELRIESALISPITEEVESAMVIKRIFDNYGDIRKHPIDQESGEMTNFVEDLMKPANVSHLQNVHLTNIIPLMDSENKDVIERSDDRNIEIAKRNGDNVKVTRAEVDPIYNEMVEIINASITLKLAKPETENFVNELNTRIKDYEAVIAARETNNSKEVKK